MSDALKDRLDAYEAKYAQDQEMAFKVAARRNKFFGLWAAEVMNISGEAAEAYAKEVIKADFEEAGDADVIRKVDTDLSGKGLEYSNEDLTAKLAAYEAEAKASFV